MFETPEAVLKFVDDLKARGARSVHIQDKGFTLTLTLAPERASTRDPLPVASRPHATNEDSTATVPIKPVRAGLGYNGL